MDVQIVHSMTPKMLAPKEHRHCHRLHPGLPGIVLECESSASVLQHPIASHVAGGPYLLGLHYHHQQSSLFGVDTQIPVES